MASVVTVSGVVGILSAILVFPEPWGRWVPWMPPVVAFVALVAATVMLRASPVLAAIVGAVALSLSAGWARAEAMPSVLSHFTNASLGLFWFALVARWAVTTARLRLVLAAAALGFVAAVAVGTILVGETGTSGPKFLPWLTADRGLAVAVPGLMQRSVNGNVVAILAASAIPLVWGSLSGVRVWGGLVIRLLVTAILLVIVVKSQSVSAYAAAGVVGMLGWIGQRTPGWQRRLVVCSAGVLVLGVATWVPGVPLPQASSSLLPQMTPDGVTMAAVPGVTGPLRGPVVRLNEVPSEGTHELRKVHAIGAGPYVMTAIVRPAGAAGVHLYGGWYARLDLDSRAVDDLGTGRAWVEPLEDDWLALRQVYLASSPTDLHIGLRLLNSFPAGEQYAGDAARGVLVSGVFLEEADGILANANLTRVLLTTSVKRSVSARWPMWEEAAGLLRSHPATGVGLDMARYRLGSRDGSEAHVHNFMLQTLLDVGGIGWLALLALFAVLVRGMVRCWSNADSDRARIGWAAALTMVAFHVFGVADSVSLGAKVGILYWVTFGVLAAAGYTQSRERVV